MSYGTIGPMGHFVSYGAFYVMIGPTGRFMSYGTIGPTRRFYEHLGEKISIDLSALEENFK